MEDVKTKIKLKHPKLGNIERTITDHSNTEELLTELKIFIKETEEAIKAGKKLSISCSNCCTSLSCFSGNEIKDNETSLKASTI